MKKILIIIGGHLSNAPRPYKEASALSDIGYDVEVFGIWSDKKMIGRDLLLMKEQRWKFSPIIDLCAQNIFGTFKLRLLNRIAKTNYQRFGAFSPELLGCSPHVMLAYARRANADLTIVHSELGLWIGSQLLNEGFIVGVDFEDWFSEDLLPKSRMTRPISHLKLLESQLIQTCKYCLTTSDAMADAMADAYEAPKPTVVYNAFPWAERNSLDGEILDRKNLNLLSLHWFSQTIGPGRGLDVLFKSLSFIDQPIEIHLRGNHPERYHQWLKCSIPDGWGDYVFVHPTVPNSELLSRIAEHDVGLALETSDIPSRNFTVTNKLFQYLQAGLAIIATNTAGQREIISRFPGCGELVVNNSPVILAKAVSKFLDDHSSLAAAKERSLAAAREMSWENQLNRLSIALERINE